MADMATQPDPDAPVERTLACGHVIAAPASVPTPELDCPNLCERTL